MLYQRAEKVLPGPQSNLRIPLSVAPTYIVRGEGARLWDVDDREYIDYMIAAGPGILGHSNKAYIEAVTEQLNRLYYTVSGATQTPMEVELAEKIVRHVPCAEKVRFGISGTEVVQLAIRLARGYTGRRVFIRFEGAYHGWLDNVLGGMTSEDPGRYPRLKPWHLSLYQLRWTPYGRTFIHPRASPWNSALRVIRNPHPIESGDDPMGTGGRDPVAFDQSFRLPWNKPDVIDKVLEKYWREVAMILVEPVQAAGCFEPKPGFLDHLRDLCDHYGILLCFDEVVTGFRLALGGAQEAYGVTPDLAT